jgi:hypothetical protein
MLGNKRTIRTGGVAEIVEQKELVIVRVPGSAAVAFHYNLIVQTSGVAEMGGRHGRV